MSPKALRSKIFREVKSLGFSRSAPLSLRPVCMARGLLYA